MKTREKLVKSAITSERGSAKGMLFLNIVVVVIVGLFIFGSIVGAPTYLSYFAMGIAFVTVLFYRRKARIEPSVILIFCVVGSIFAFGLFGQSLKIQEALFALLYYLFLLTIATSGVAVVRNSNTVLIVGVATVVCVALVLLSSSTEVMQQIQQPDSSGRVRIFGSFESPNTLGAASYSAIICLVSYNIITRQKVLVGKLCSVTIVALFLILLLTDSRTSIIVAISFVVVLIFCLYSPRLSDGARLLSKIAAVLLLGVFIYAMVDYSLEIESMRIRLQSAQALLSGDLDTLLFGYGMLSSGGTQAYFIQASGVVHADIAWVMILMKSGLIGLLANIALVVFIALRMRKVQNAYIRACGFAAMAAFLAGTLGENYMASLSSLPSLLWWMFPSALSDVGFSVVRKDKVE